MEINAKIDENNKLNYILSSIFIISSICFSLSVYVDIENYNNAIIKTIFCSILFVALTLYLFIKNKTLIKNIFSNIQCNKWIILLSVLSTISFQYIIIESHPNLNNLIITFAVFGFFTILTLFVAAFKFIFEKIKNFYLSLTKSEKIFILVTFSFFFLLFTISLCLTKLFIGVPHPEFGRWVEILSFDVGWSNGAGLYVNPFTINNVRHFLVSYSILPFTCIPYVLINLFNAGNYFGIYFLFLQYFIIATIIIILKRLLKINNIYGEIAFYVLIFLSSTFIINMSFYEKFVIPVFYLVLTIKAVIEKSKLKYFYYFMAIMSLSTLLLFFPIVFFEKGKTFKQIIKELIYFAIITIILLILTSSYTILFTALKSTESLLASYGSKDIVLNILHYFTLLTQLIVIPDIVLRYPHAWATEPTFSSFYFILGIIIFIMCIAGFILNRKEKIYQICLYWFFIIIFFVVILGWGVGANECFLSSFSYYWAIAPLIFGLFNKLIKNKKLLLSIFIIIMLMVTGANTYEYIEILKIAHQVLPT